MPKTYKAPGFYVEDVSFRPSQIAQVETAIPAFVGYTEKAEINGKSVLNQGIKVNSLSEFESCFGGKFSPSFTLAPKTNDHQHILTIAGQDYGIDLLPFQRSFLFEAVNDFFANGGRICYIVSVGVFSGKREVKIKREALLGIQSPLLRNPKQKGLKSLEKIKEVTLVVIPDAVLLEDGAYEIYREMLAHCQKAGNRFAILDIPNGDQPRNPGHDGIEKFRKEIGNNHLSFGAAYYPWLERSEIPNFLTYRSLDPKLNLIEVLPEQKAKEVLQTNQANQENLHLVLWNISPSYRQIIESMAKILKPSPPSGAIAGIYSMVDQTRGVWRPPANVSLMGFEKPVVTITDEEQELLNIDALSGKSINSIRFFKGKGILVWGIRTLAGNNPELNYVSVKRTVLMIKESIENAVSQFVFEPNDANTWTRVRMVVSFFLFGLWRQGAFIGAKADESYFVKIGLGETMTSQDILERKGVLIIGFALLKPLEFHVLKIEIAFG